MIALLLENENLDNADCKIYTCRDELSEDISFGLVDKQDIVLDTHDEEFKLFCKEHGFNVIFIEDYLKQNINEDVKDTNVIEVISEVKDVVITQSDMKAVSDVIDSSISNNTKTARVGIISKAKNLFKKKQVEPIELSVNILDTVNINNLTLDITKGKDFRNYLIQQGYMSKEDVELVVEKQKEAKKFSKKRRFIELAIEMNLIDEELGCKILSKGLNKEICSYNSLNINHVVELTKPFYDGSIDFNFVYLEIDKERKELVVGYDLSTNVSYYKIEENFADYAVRYKYFIEGTTSRILCAM